MLTETHATKVRPIHIVSKVGHIEIACEHGLFCATQTAMGDWEMRRNTRLEGWATKDLEGGARHIGWHPDVASALAKLARPRSEDA